MPVETISLDKQWEVDTDYFVNVDERVFMDAIREFEVLYATNQKSFKEKRTTRVNALRSVACKFKGTTDMVEGRYVNICVL